MFKITVVPLLISLMVTVVCIVENVQAEDKCTDAAGCNGHGTCVGNTGSQACNCTDGYGGETCDTAPICTARGKECLHGGTCDITKTPAVCNCTGIYTGDKCQNAPICTARGKECLHGGTCDITKTPAVCNCSGIYTGVKCQNGAVFERMSAYCVIFGLASYWITTWAHIV